MRKLELDKFGVVEIHSEETREIRGGLIPSWLKKLGPAALGAWVIENWSDIKKGAADAWADYDKKYEKTHF